MTFEIKPLQGNSMSLNWTNTGSGLVVLATCILTGSTVPHRDGIIVLLYGRIFTYLASELVAPIEHMVASFCQQLFKCHGTRD